MSGTTGNEVRVGTDLSPEEARALTDEIRASMEELAPVVTRAYKGRVWIALGYESWEAWVAGELGGPLRLGRNDRKQAVAELRQAGMSTRGIGTALGVHHDTIAEDVKELSEIRQLPDSLTGTDGKTYSAVRPDPERPARATDEGEHQRRLARVQAAEWFMPLEIALATLREARTWAMRVNLQGRDESHIREVRSLVTEAGQIVAFIEERVR